MSTSLNDVIKRIIEKRQRALPRSEVTTLINTVIKRVGGRRDMSYLKVLDTKVQRCEWASLVHNVVDARIVWGVTLGAGISGPSAMNEPTQTYLYGAYHAWPLYSNAEELPSDAIQSLILTLLYGIEGLLSQPHISDNQDLMSILSIKQSGKYLNRIKGLNRKCQNPTSTDGDTDDVLKRNVDLSSEIITQNKFKVINFVLTPKGEIQGISDLATSDAVTGQKKPGIIPPPPIGEIIDSLLFAAWAIIGNEVDTYASGILSGVFPALCMGANIRSQRLVALATRIDTELGLSTHITVSDATAPYIWEGMKEILKVSPRARVAAYRCKLISSAIGSVWVGIFGSRMQYHGMSSVVLVATAVSLFPNAGWSNFFDIDQDPYTPEMLHLNDSPLSDWKGFIDVCSDMVSLSFRPADFHSTEDPEVKKVMIIEAFQALRPRKNVPEWRNQGSIFMTVAEEAIEDPYLMYTGRPGRTREMGDLVYYSFLILRDVAKQASLEGYRNSLHSYSKKPSEIESLVQAFKKVLVTFPGNKGVLEMQKTDLPKILTYLSSDDPFVDDGGGR